MENIYDKEEDFVISVNLYNITDINFTHYYDDNELGGSSCYTRLNIISDFDYIDRKFSFKGQIIHTYRDYNDEFDIKTIEKNIDITNNIVEEINKLNLEELKNNYYNKDNNKEYWVINYNKLFYIVGTYDSELNEVDTLLELVNFENIKNECLEEVKHMK